MKKNILITGGAGFIGTRLSLKLISSGHNVTVLDSLEKQIHGENPFLSPLYKLIEGKVKFIHANVSNADVLKEALIGIDTVVHFAAETGTGQSMYAIKHYVDVNVSATALLLELIAAKESKVKKIIVASSRAIYGEGAYQCASHGVFFPDQRNDSDMSAGDFEIHCPKCNQHAELIPTEETCPAKPASIYGITKYNQEQMFLLMGKSLGITAIAYRYQNVYGPGQSLTNPYTGILSIFSTRIRNNNEILIFEDGKESRDFVFIDDVVNATAAGVEYDKVIQEVFNVGSGEATSVLHLATKLKSYFENDIAIKVTGNYRIGDIRHNIASLSHIKEVLGYTPTVKFEDGLKKFVDWVKGEAKVEDKYQASIDELKNKGLFK